MIRSLHRILMAVLLCISAQALAMVETAVQVDAGAVADSNPFRFYDGLAAQVQQGNSSTADHSIQANVSAGAIVPVLSDQTRLILSGAIGKQEFHRYHNLNNDPRALNAVFEWVAYDVLAGKVGIGREQRLFQYINGSLTQRDMSDLRPRFAEIQLKVTPELSLPLKLERSSLSYELPQNQAYNTEMMARQLGVRYVSGTGSSFEAGLRLSETRFPDRTAQQIANLDDRYTDSEAFAEAEWKYSIKSAAFAHVGSIKRSYSNLNGRDRRLLSLYGRGDYEYSPKLRVDVQWWDRPFLISDQNILYVLSKGLRIDTAWQYSEKTQFRLFGSMQHDDNHLIDPNAVLNTVARSDKLGRIGFTINYNPERALRLFLSGYREQLRQEGNFAGIHQNVLKFGLAYTYENLQGGAQRMGLARYSSLLSGVDP